MKRKVFFFFMLILLFYILLFFNRIIFFDLIYFQRDITLQFKPWKFFIKEVLFNIQNTNLNYLDFLPLWNPYNQCGMPLIANLQSQVFYPLSIIFYLIKDFSTAFKIFIIIHFFMSMIFMFMFLLSKRLNFFSCLVGSLLWVFNGYIITRIEFLSVFSTVLWLPLIILVFSNIKNLELKKIIYLSLVIAVQFLAGHAQMWIYSMAFLTLYAIYQSYKNNSWVPFLSLIYSILFSLAISAIQFLPTFEFFYHSTRAGEGIKSFSKFGMSYNEVKLGSLNIIDLLNFIYPFNWQLDIKNISFAKANIQLTNYWLYTFYIGFVGVALAIIGFFYIKNLKEKFFYSFIIALVIFHSLGENFIFFRILYKIFPFIRIFRYPSTIIYISLFILSILSAHGVEYIYNFLKKQKYKKLIFLLLAACFFELYFYNTKISMLLPKSILDEKKEIINFLIKQNEKDNHEYRFAHTPLTLKISTFGKSKNLYSAIAKYRDKLFGNINLEYHLYNFAGQDIELKTFNKFLDFVYSRKSLEESLVFFSIANVKYILSIIKYEKNNWKILNDDEEVLIYENPFVLKRIYPVDKIIIEPNLDKSLKIIEDLKFDILKTAIVHSDKVNLLHFKKQVLNKYKFVINHAKFYPNKIFMNIFAEQPTFLVLSQNYYPGWKCFINNQKTKIFHCNIFMSGIYLPKGENYIYMCYDPLSFKLGCIITLSCLLFILLFLFETQKDKISK